eukprot:jgi/Tetstr1/439637/TSEL_028059.t1
MCNTGRIVEDVRQALFRGHATEIHIRVHPEQPQGDDAFGYAFADMLNNCAEPKQYDAAGKKHPEDKVVLLMSLTDVWPRDTQTGSPYPLKKTQRAGGIIKPNTNAVKSLAARQAVPGDNVDEGSSPEPPQEGQATRLAGARAGGGALGSRAGRRAAVAAAATREQQAGRQGGPGQNRM